MIRDTLACGRGPQRTHQGGSFLGIGPFDDDTEV